MGIFDFELWWLIIIPISFIFGWYSSRYEKDNSSADPKLIPDAYLNSFNSLIQNKKSEAIKELEQIIDSDLFTVDLQNILGNLYRDNGHLEKSIFIRTSLLNRVDLNKEKRNLLNKRIFLSLLSGLFILSVPSPLPTIILKCISF